MVKIMKKFKYTYSLLYKLPGDNAIQFLSIDTDVNGVYDMTSLIQQQIQKCNIPDDAQLISINLSNVN